MKKWFALFLVAAQVNVLPQQALASATKPDRKPTGLSSKAAPAAESRNAVMNRFITSLMKQMTLDEKLGQLNLLSIGSDVTGPVLSKGGEGKIAAGQVGGVFNLLGPSSIRKLQNIAVNKSRLHIPLFFGYDVIHGHRTIFPVPLGLASSWDMKLLERTASAAAREASADGLNWTFSPMVDIARDPRWGRVCEGSGEDTYLGGKIAEAMVHGYQGDNYQGTDKVMACVKHFALYGAAEAGRDYNTVDMSRLRMYNEYLPPYRAAVDAGAASVMGSFNELDGLPASGNKWLMTDLLRKQWGFKGFVVTDYTAIQEMKNHGVGDEKKVTEMSLNAGVDMDMVSEYFTAYGATLVKSGRVSQAQVEAACRRILEAKYRLGLFHDPYRFLSENRYTRETLSPDKLALSKEAAVKSMVLLKNNNNILPLRPEQKIAFIGPLVEDKHNLLGCWRGAGDDKTISSIAEALANKFKGEKFIYAKGCNLIDDKALIEKLNRDDGQLSLDKRSPQELLDEAMASAREADVVVAVLGESFMMSGEAASRSNIDLFENQMNLLKALKKIGKPIVLVLMNGRPLALSWEDKNMDAILETWFAGTRAGDAIVDVLFGEAPSGKLPMSFPQNLGQVPIYYNAKSTGRPWAANEKYHSQYLDVSNEPLYPFGHGLTYTTFKFGDIKLSSKILNFTSNSPQKQVPGSTTLTVSTTVTNTGERSGVETVQLYVRDLVGSITRPVKELKGFKKVALKPGESQTVTFNLTSDDLRFYDSDLRYQAEPGDFKVFVGSSSKDVKEADFRLVDSVILEHRAKPAL